MGLDIIAWKKVEFRRERVAGVEIDHDSETWLYRGPAADRTDGLAEGVYAVSDEAHGFRAGSYSGYNEWREWLSVAMVGVLPRTIWEDRGRYAGRPFVELIDFADNEGFIGPNTSEKLARDFAEHHEQAKARALQAFGPVVAPHYVRLYEDFMKAFKLAAGTGAVKFT